MATEVRNKAGQTKREQYEILRAQLDQERSSFKPTWRDIADFILPRRPRFFVDDVNRGERRNQKIIDSTGTLAARTLRSGMMAGVTSPARPWFRLSTPDPSLSEFGPVKEWLHDVTVRMQTFFLRSNIYNSLPILYGDMGVFGTAAMMIEEDFEDVIRSYPFPLGSYYIANDDKGRVRVAFREFKMTVRQLVMKFAKRTQSGQIDWSNFSTCVKDEWERGNYETWIHVAHVIQPNPDFDASKIHSKYKAFTSCYYERGYTGSNTTTANYMSQDPDKYLRESGYDYFPLLAPRWEVNDGDCYGTSCPGIDALGDVKQLQMQQRRKAQALELFVKPPMTGPGALRQAKATILPGEVTYTDEREGQKGFRPTFQVDPRINELRLDNLDIQRLIQRAFYEDLFLMLANSDRREITAREIDERHEEKLLALGPMLEQLNQDLLDPLIDIAFLIGERQGQFPDAPKELQGMNLKVEYVSVMAQAQKMVGLAGLERFAGFAANIIKLSGDPTMVDKVNFDELIEEHADATGVPPKIIRTDDQVAEIKKARQKQQQTAQAIEGVTQVAGAAKDLAGADMSGDNALTRIANKAQGAQPQAA